jgi:hypothetical protein
MTSPSPRPSPNSFWENTYTEMLNLCTINLEKILISHVGKYGKALTASSMIMCYVPHQDEVRIKVKEVLYCAS